MTTINPTCLGSPHARATRPTVLEKDPEGVRCSPRVSHRTGDATGLGPFNRIVLRWGGCRLRFCGGPRVGPRAGGGVGASGGGFQGDARGQKREGIGGDV